MLWHITVFSYVKHIPQPDDQSAVPKAVKLQSPIRLEMQDANDNASANISEDIKKDKRKKSMFV